MTDPFLYRFDGFRQLREQRRTDRVLRGRLLEANEPEFPHHQINTAHQTLRQGEGVFRLSFWKSWDTMRLNVWGRREGTVLQRVRADHPVLKQMFSRDHDEYLEHEAWLYWATLPIDPEYPNWSPAGIPHQDLEVMRPDGSWVTMDDVPELNDAAGPGWSSYRFRNSSSIFDVHAAVGTLAPGTPAVLLRKSIGPWPNLYSDLKTAVREVVQELLTTGAVADADRTRWFFAQELSNGVVADEFFPSVLLAKTRIVERLNRLFGAPPRPPAITVVLSDDTSGLSPADTAKLYSAFDILPALEYEASWHCRLLIPTEDEQRQIRAALHLNHTSPVAPGRVAGWVKPAGSSNGRTPGCTTSGDYASASNASHSSMKPF